jgi:NAD(P)-dependent dehydrogenase (short-subunit alcohol dehydrogenase family)
MAQGFLEAGAERVYITARKAAPCLEAAEALSQFGDCVALPGDISTTEGLIELVAELNQRESHLDVLVNNAGTAWAASFGQVPEVGWDKVMDLNVKSPFFLIQALTPLLTSESKRRANRRDYQYWLDCWHVG